MIKTLLLALSAALPLASAIGSAKIENKCNFPVTVWAVGGSISAGHTLAPGVGFSEALTYDPVSGGRALKVTREPDGLFTGRPQTIFAYTLDGSRVWYDLSDVFGDAFAGHKLVEASDETSCQAIVWPAGVPPGGSQVKVCSSAFSVTLTLCAP